MWILLSLLVLFVLSTYLVILQQTASSQDGQVITWIVHGVQFHVDKRYTLMKSIGQGAYGVVW